MSRRFAPALGAVVLLALAGCAAPSSAADGEYPGLPVGITDEELGAGYGEPLAYWTGAQLHLAIAGSSSCPMIPTELVEGRDGVEIALQRGGGDGCTDDLVYRTHVFRLDDVPTIVVVDDAGARTEVEVVRVG